MAAPDRIVVAGYARSAFQPARKGALASVRPDDLAAHVVAALVERTGVPTDEIEDIVLGCAFPEGEQGYNLGRIVSVLAGLPRTVAGCTVNRLCGSSMQAVHAAAGCIALGAGEAYICAGVESMSRVPMWGFNVLLHPVLAADYPAIYMSMGETAENVADRYGISRERQEAFACTSHHKASAAATAERLSAEIVEIEGVATDGCVRPGTSPEGLAALKPAFLESGTVTAGTSSPLTDGAAAVLITSESFADRHGLEPLAAIRSIAVAGCDPEIMGIGPVAASRKALERAGIEVSDLDVVELNEAFASQALACIDDLGLAPETINVDGGALALGHPLGATGARIVGKAAQILHRDGGRFALATQCVGGGQGVATILEAL